MKKTVFLAYTALFICLLLPLMRQDMPPEPVSAPAADPAPAEETSPAEETLPPSEPPGPERTPGPETEAGPEAETVRLLTGDGEILELDMQEYLTGVLAAEMPASFEPEALKAQAVAARSFALYCASGNKHGQAQVCADYACCQAWQDEAALREKWGGSYELYAEKLRAAAESTAGQVLLYEGQPIFAAFHASSAGATEASGEIWNPLPYLVSVSSPETDQTVPNFVSTLDCAALDFRDALLSIHPEADFTGEESGWIGETVRDGSGRVKSQVLGGVEMSGTELRSLFSLRSTAFELTYGGGRFLFTVTGNGHGVGMSQYGAQVMAASGSDYREILSHYYPGTELSG